MEKCQKVWNSAETILPFSCCPLVFLWLKPWSSFPCLFGKRQGKPPRKQGFLMLAEPLKSLRMKGKPLKIARNSLKRKKARKSKKARKRRLGRLKCWSQMPTRLHKTRAGRGQGCEAAREARLFGGYERASWAKWNSQQSGSEKGVYWKRGLFRKVHLRDNLRDNFREGKTGTKIASGQQGDYF